MKGLGFVCGGIFFLGGGGGSCGAAVWAGFGGLCWVWGGFASSGRGGEEIWSILARNGAAHLSHCRVGLLGDRGGRAALGWGGGGKK